MEIYKKEEAIKDNRNYGIDLLRIVSMFYIVLLHSFSHGGLIKNTILDSNQYKLACFIEICSIAAVNIFALISGYVSYKDKETKFKPMNYIKLWLEVVFYGLLLTFLFDRFMPSVKVTSENYLEALLPVTNKMYWYFTAYTGLFILIPFINTGIRYCDNNMLKKLFVLIILVFSCFANVSKTFGLSEGYSFIWIVLLYILGAIMKKCDIGKNIKTYQVLLTIIVLYIITFMYRMSGFEYEKMNISITKEFLISYISPTMVIAAIMHIILFSRFKFYNWINKIIKFGASSAFSIYLLNDNILVRNYVMKDLFAGIARGSSLKILLYVLGFAITFVIVSILIDKIRMLIFKILGINKICDKIEVLLNKSQRELPSETKIPENVK